MSRAPAHLSSKAGSKPDQLVGSPSRVVVPSREINLAHTRIRAADNVTCRSPNWGTPSAWYVAGFSGCWFSTKLSGALTLIASACG